MEPNETVILAEQGNSWIEGWTDDEGKDFEFFNVYFGNNFTCVSLPAEDFSEIVDLFRELIANEKEPVGLN